MVETGKSWHVHDKDLWYIAHLAYMLYILKGCRLNTIYWILCDVSQPCQAKTVTQTQVANASALNFGMALVDVCKESGSIIWNRIILMFVLLYII
jgi:hypothetical protein